MNTLKITGSPYTNYEEFDDGIIVSLKEGGEIVYIPIFLDEATITPLMQKLLELEYEQPSIIMHEKEVKIPRLQAWIASDDVKDVAVYQSRQNRSKWFPEMRRLKNKIESVVNNLEYDHPLDFQFNYVLINQYRDGKDSISWHSDKEAIPYDKSVIGSVSLGATRTFHLKNGKGDKISIDLPEGSLLIMNGSDIQKNWKHSVPKRANAETRINLTFRKS